MENFEKCTVAMLGGPCSQHVTGNTSWQNQPQSAIIWTIISSAKGIWSKTGAAHPVENFLACRYHKISLVEPILNEVREFQETIVCFHVVLNLGLSPKWVMASEFILILDLSINLWGFLTRLRTLLKFWSATMFGAVARNFGPLHKFELPTVIADSVLQVTRVFSLASVGHVTGHMVSHMVPIAQCWPPYWKIFTVNNLATVF